MSPTQKCRYIFRAQFFCGFLPKGGRSLFHKMLEGLRLRLMSVTVWLVQEIAELQDQLRDLMFYLEAKQTLATTTEATQQEIQAGQIIVQPPTTSGQGGKKSRKKTR